MNNNGQKVIWTVLIVILVILIIWGIVAAYDHSSSENSAQQTSSTTSASGNTSSGASNSSGSSNNSKVPVIGSLSPENGRAGLNVTITGSNFDIDNNYVEFGSFNLGQVGSTDGIHINFVVPESIKTCSATSCTTVDLASHPGAYSVAVRNSQGTSNVTYYMVTTPTTSQ